MMDWAYFEKLVSPAAELLNSLIPTRDFASVPGSRAQEHELGRLCFRTCSCEAGVLRTGAAVASPSAARSLQWFDAGRQRYFLLQWSVKTGPEFPKGIARGVQRVGDGTIAARRTAGCLHGPYLTPEGCLQSHAERWIDHSAAGGH